MIEVLRSIVIGEIFDYAVLMQALSTYKKPRSKVTQLLKSRKIIRIKKGLYVFNELYRKKTLSSFVLANLIYGPSYLSLESALAYYHLIPESVYTQTSVTTGRSRMFKTQIGLFTYQNIPMKAFSPGVTQAGSVGESFLIALPEKAIADKVRLTKNLLMRTISDAKKFIFEDLRISPDAFFDLSHARLQEYAEHYRSKKISLVAKLMAQGKQENTKQ